MASHSENDKQAQSKKNIRIEPLFRNRRSQSCSSTSDLETNRNKRPLGSPNDDRPCKKKPASPRQVLLTPLSQLDDKSDIDDGLDSSNMSESKLDQYLQTALDRRLGERSHVMTNDDWFSNDMDKAAEIDSSFKTLGSDFNSSKYLTDDPAPPVPRVVAHLAVMNAIQVAVNEALTPMMDQMVSKSSVKNIIEDAVHPLLEKINELTKSMDQLNKKSTATSEPQKRFFSSTVNNEQLLNPQYNASPSYQSNKEGWGLTDQGRKAKNPNLTLPVPKGLKAPIPAQSKSAPISVSTDNPAFQLARKCQGFHPISSIDIGRVGANFSHIKDDEKRFQATGKKCILNFLKDEMDISDRIISDIRIKSVFFPPMGAGSATLYAEFYSEDEVKLIKSYSKNLSTTEEYKAKLVIYVPRSLQERLKAVEAAAYQIRKDSSKTVMTRIWITTDFELRAKRKGNNASWASISPILLPNLPAQAPKRDWNKMDVLDQRTPPTPYYQSEDIRTFNNFNLLEDNCEN